MISHIKKKWKVPVLRHKFFPVIQAVGVTIFFAWFFYRSPWGIPAAFPLGIIRYRNVCQNERQKEIRKLKLQFEDMLLAIETNMRAGYSVENAFCEAGGELRERFGEKDLFVQRMFSIKQGLEHNMPLEHLLYAFGEECGVEEIREFGEIFAAAKRAGGKMSEILISSAQVIGQGIQTEEEIQVLLTAKKMEGKIMQVVPFFIVMYLQVTSPDFFQVLYHNPMGMAIMGAMEGLYATAGVWSRKILAISV